MVSEPMAAYAPVSTSQPPVSHPAAPFLPSDDTDESFIMDVDPELGARRAEWGRQHFDRLLAEAEKLYGHDENGLMTVEQYFGKLWYIVKKGYEAIPG